MAMCATSTQRSCVIKPSRPEEGGATEAVWGGTVSGFIDGFVRTQEVAETRPLQVFGNSFEFAHRNIALCHLPR